MKICTCVAVCKGIESLGEGWVCGLTLCPNPQCRNGVVDTGAVNPDGSWINIACPWEGHENKINPEWLKLENKPHLVPAICHPDAFKAFYLGPVTLAQLDAVTVGHWKEQRALVEWAITLLSSATPNQKLLSEDMQKEWCKGFGQWFAEASTGMPSIKLDPNGVYVHICKWLMEKPGRSIHRIDNLYRAICSTANKEQGWYADTATLPLLSDAILNCPK